MLDFKLLAIGDSQTDGDVVCWLQRTSNVLQGAAGVSDTMFGQLVRAKGGRPAQGGTDHQPGCMVHVLGHMAARSHVTVCQVAWLLGRMRECARSHGC